MRIPPSASLRRAFAVALVFGYGLTAQTSKRPLSHRDYDGWRNIQNQQISRDGRYLAYALFPQAGDGELVVRDLRQGKEQRVPIGQRPPAPPPSFAGAEETRPEPPGITLAFSRDSRTLVFTTFPSKAETDQAKQKNNAAPKGGLVILALGGEPVRIPRVKNFQLPGEGGSVVAYLRDGDSTPESATFGPTPAPGEPGAPRRERRNEYGTALVLRSLADGAERTFADATEYRLRKDGTLLVYAVGSKDEETNGVYAVTPGRDATPQRVLAGKGRYTQLAWDDPQKQLAFLSNRDEVADKQPRYSLYVWKAEGGAEPLTVVPAAQSGLRQGYVLSERGALTFTKNGQRLFFGCTRQAAEQKKSTLPADDQPVVDLWHWKDDRIQPMQKVRAELERTRSFRAVVHLGDRKTVQLGDTEVAEITPSEDGRYALGGDDREYRAAVEYDERYADTYLVDTLTGARKLLAKKHLGGVSWSPDGKHALLFNGKDWNAISVPDGTTVNLTGKLGVNFAYEDHDSPGTPQPYGAAGWTKDGRYVLLYDHYDIWRVTPDAREAKTLTEGVGRQSRTMFRYVKLDPQAKSVDPAQPLLLRAENIETHDTGFYRDTLDGTAPPEKLLMQPRNLSAPVKAKEADVLLLTAETFGAFPDLHVTDSSFRELKKVSDGNPQQERYLWGTAELVKFHSMDGAALQGVLYKPENFDPKKRYPLLVYIYEKLSQNYHNYVPPRPTNSINVSYYVSNGYLVFTPDIVYRVGYPGESALKCVLPGVQAITDRGYVDEKSIGIQGHSWGGYQIAYMITQTNRFRAVAAGAPVANMTSAYNGIRWGPGIPRQFQYERTQSRIGGSLWQYPLRYIENSPVFHADKVQTPVLMIHNDADDAVPWYQGIEFYLSLRRLGKEVYLFNYNGEPHNLRKRANQKDYTIRLQQYFDYFLKAGPKPDWMEHGIPYLEREQEKEKMKAIFSDGTQ